MCWRLRHASVLYAKNEDSVKRIKSIDSKTKNYYAPEDDTTGYTRIILYIDKFKMQQFDEKFPHLNLVPFFREHYGVYNLTQKQQEKFLHMYEVLKTEFSNRSRSYKALIEMEIILY